MLKKVRLSKWVEKEGRIYARNKAIQLNENGRNMQ